MGLFDFLNFGFLKTGKEKESKTGSGEHEPSPDYAFAHYALRSFALGDPITTLAILASPKSNELLDTILSDVAELTKKRPSFSSSDITIHAVRVAGYPCAILEFPEPKEIAEVHMVAVLLLSDPSASDDSSDGMANQENSEGRYFTLEKSFSLSSNEEATVLAEWGQDNQRFNYGEGPVPDPEAFATALEEFITGSKESSRLSDL